MYFRYDRESPVLRKLEFDPEKVICKIEEVVSYLSERLSLPYTMKRLQENVDDIKPSDIYCTLAIEFTGDLNRLTGTMKVLVPEIRWYTNIKGIKRFVQNQIRDLLYINKPKSCRVISEYPPFSMYLTKENIPVFSIEGNPAYAVPLYLLLATDTEEGADIGKLEQFDFSEHLQDMMDVNKQDDYFKKMSQVRNTSTNRSKFLYELVLAMFDSSAILKEFFNTPADIILSMIEKIFEDEDDDKGVGLDLTHRRLRTVQEMISYDLCWEIMTKILYNRFIISKQRRDLNCVIDPFRGIYDFVLTETMFHAPLASLSNKFRATLTGSGGFNKDNVPLSLKDLHPSQFRNICPIVTPDREKAGIVLYLSYCSDIDKLGRFELTPLEGYDAMYEIERGDDQ